MKKRKRNEEINLIFQQFIKFYAVLYMESAAFFYSYFSTLFD